MKKILLLAAVAATWVSCQDEKKCEFPSNDPNEIRITSTIANIEPALDSRTTITGSTAAWANGDALGLYCPQSMAPGVNVQYTVSGIGTTPVWATTTPIYWANGTTSHTFLAYSPYASGNTDPAAVKLPAIGTQTGTIAPAMDFLISNNLGTTGVTRAGGAVGLTFKHAFALIQLDLVLGNGVAAGTTLTSFTLASATSSDKLYTTDGTSTIALSSGTITPAVVTNTATVTPASAPTLSATPTPVYVLLLPGTFTAPTLTINLQESSVAVAVPAASLGTTTFAANTKYTYTVTVSRTAITISNPTITDWTNVNGGSINPGI